MLRNASRKILNGHKLSERFYQFIATGQWADGHLAYSRLDSNGEIIPEEEGCYAQIKLNHELVMVRI